MLEFLAHEGVGHLDDPPGRGSGRYAWGSGENPGQHQYTFMSEIERFRKRGMTDSEIAKALLGNNATTADLKAEIAIQRTNERRELVYRARQLLEECGGNVSEVGRRMNKSESSVRKLLDKSLEESQDKYANTAEYLRKQIDKKGVIDIGPGSEISMNVTNNTMKVAVAMLEKEGYIVGKAQVPQQTSNNKTTISVICPPDVKFSETKAENGKTTKWIDWKTNPVNTIEDYSPNGGKDYDTVKKPSSLDSSRIKIVYKEDGGNLKDGVIELRPGVKDLNLGKSQYAQVRIAVDGTHYLKGMAMYGDPETMPKGVDVLFNTNKSSDVPKMDVLKELKVRNNGEVDWDNPFGALIKRGGQSFYEDKNGEYIKKGDIFVKAEKGDKGERYSLSPINKLREEGDWDTWSRTLSSQFLSKQPLKVINQQIKISLGEKRSEFADINNLTNPEIKKKMLLDFADKCEANASDLSVKGFKGQSYQVILPITKMKDNEVYAPNYKDGDTVALIRYPHGGTFEIPTLKVNNNHNPAAKKVMENARDAVGITPNVAERLSGADFDGDFVAVLPLTSNRISLTSTDPLPGLIGFDPKSYKLPDDAPRITNKRKQTEMGKITNLITDMTIQGADPAEITRAVKHSMVVIDSEKHHLDYKASAKNENIAELKKKYQSSGGAATIFSKSNADVYINQLKEVTDVKKMTPAEVKAFNAGKKVYRETGKTRTKTTKITDPNKMTPEELKLYQSGRQVVRYTDKQVPVQQKVSRRSTVDNAIDLVYDTNNPKEMAYANYSNELMELSYEARKIARSIKPVPVSQSAKKTYAEEVESLNAKLRIAKSNNPKERVATNIAAIRSSEYIKAHPELDYEHKSRIRTQEMQKARDELGAHKQRIDITPREFEAIQANAISTNKLKEILANANEDAIRKMASPNDSKTIMTDAKIDLMTTMYNSGMYTQKDIAEKFGVSTTMVSKAVKGEL